MKIVNKLKAQFKRFMTGKSGFSLVELIVVIAIMAVMAAVLAPALLGYVEKSRAQKDDSALNEVTNSMQLALADADIYDELVNFAVEDNYSCYCDGDSTTNTNANRTITKSPNLWLFNDNARLLDETVYKPAGKMRGVTVTFKPNGKSEYILKDGIVNQIGNDSTKKGSGAGKTLADANFERLYNRVRSTVGDTIKVNSQTYKNSDYTIFISMGTTGGSQADKQDAIQVYGQYNGTNLPEVANASNITGGSQDEHEIIIRKGIVPDDCTYTPNGETPIKGNGTNIFPKSPKRGDIYEEGDYKYTYYRGGDYGTKWSAVVLDKTKSSYGKIITEIAGEPVTNVCRTFKNCKSLVVAPIIPNGVTNMFGTFGYCSSLIKAPEIPESVRNLYWTFGYCSSLIESPEIPSGVTNMVGMFYDCKSLVVAPTIPNNIKDLSLTFQGCKSMKTYDGSTDPDGDFSSYKLPSTIIKLQNTFNSCKSMTKGPKIPSKVTDLTLVFSDCSSLVETPDMNNADSVTNMHETFKNCASLTTVSSLPKNVKNMTNTFLNCSSLVSVSEMPDSVTNVYGTFQNCSSLVTAPKISSSITSMPNMFLNCYKLTVAPVIPNGVTGLSQTFANCTSLVIPPDIPDSVTNMYYTFSRCSSLSIAPKIPDNVKNMDSTFYRCYKLTTAPKIPCNVTNMSNTFVGCTSLTGIIEINANPTSYGYCFHATTKPITLIGKSTILNEISKTANNKNVIVE